MVKRKKEKKKGRLNRNVAECSSDTSNSAVQARPSTQKNKDQKKEAVKGLKDAAPVASECCCCTRLLKNKTKKKNQTHHGSNNMDPSQVNLHWNWKHTHLTTPDIHTVRVHSKSSTLLLSTHVQQTALFCTQQTGGSHSVRTPGPNLCTRLLLGGGGGGGRTLPVSKINKSLKMEDRRMVEESKCKRGGEWGVPAGRLRGLHSSSRWRSGLNIVSQCVFIHGGSPGSCCSRWRSSRAAWRPTARCWSPLRPCRPGWGPRWPGASAGCPRSGPGGRPLWEGGDARRSHPFIKQRFSNFPAVLLPAVQMWHEECGAQAMPLTQARWLLSRATGVHGTRTSRMTTWSADVKNV